MSHPSLHVGLELDPPIPCSLTRDQKYTTQFFIIIIIEQCTSATFCHLDNILEYHLNNNIDDSPSFLSHKRIMVGNSYKHLRHNQVHQMSKKLSNHFFIQMFPVSIFVTGPLNQCLAVRIHDKTARMNRPPTATGV